MDSRETQRTLEQLTAEVADLRAEVAALEDRPALPSMGPTEIDALLGGNQADGTNAYRYGFDEAELTVAGGGWAAKSGGTSEAASSTYAAYNRWENINDATGMQGSGVNVDDLPFGATGVSILAAAEGLHVRMRKVPIPDATEAPWYRWEFEAPNGIDGECT